jgi:hypothetical protein
MTAAVRSVAALVLACETPGCRFRWTFAVNPRLGAATIARRQLAAEDAADAHEQVGGHAPTLREVAAVDLFGNEGPLPRAMQRPPEPVTQLDLLDAAAERAALASGRPKSQERAEIVSAQTRHFPLGGHA